MTVADNPLLIETIRIAFRASGEFKLAGYADPHRTSAEAILGAKPDAVLLDDPGNCEETIVLLRQIKAHDPQLAVRVLSVRLDLESVDALFEAGGSGVISKATSPHALVALVRGTLNVA